MSRMAEDVLNVMRSWIGYSEANGKYRAIIDLYNSVTPLPRDYAVQYSDEWCDATISAAGIQAGCSDLIGRECGCEEHIQLFKEMGIWIEDGTIVPEPGYIILFSWGSNIQPNNGHANHIGIVENVSGNTISTIEGNMNEAVGRRTIAVGNGNIRGYAAPKYYKQIPGARAYTQNRINYRVHQQSAGWWPHVEDGQVAGAPGHSKQIEAVKIDVKLPGIILRAQAHIQGIGWRDYGIITSDTVIGTVEEGKRLEGISLEAENIPNGMNLYVRFYIQEDGWSEWIRGGTILGTAGLQKRLEAIQLKIE